MSKSNLNDYLIKQIISNICYNNQINRTISLYERRASCGKITTNKKYLVHEIVIMKNRYEPNNDSDNYFVWSKCNF
jgi:hypothetical protein